MDFDHDHNIVMQKMSLNIQTGTVHGPTSTLSGLSLYLPVCTESIPCVCVTVCGMPCVCVTVCVCVCETMCEGSCVCVCFADHSMYKRVYCSVLLVELQKKRGSRACSATAMLVHVWVTLVYHLVVDGAVGN